MTRIPQQERQGVLELKIALLKYKFGNEKTAMDYGKFIVITNRKLCKREYLEQMEYVISLHPHALILREKDLPDEEYEALARQVKSICDRSKVDFYLHSRDEIAHRIHCDNLHLSIPELRRVGEKGKDFKQISVSCHSLEDVREAEEAGASQIVLGTIFETDCKPGKIGAGLSFVKEISNQTSIPIYAIGGITEANIESVIEAGAAGGCMMSGFMNL